MPVSAAIGRYPHTAALLDGRISSTDLALECADVPVISRAFAPMVREARYGISEMAIATFLQAQAHGKPLVLLPVAMAARFQEAALLCRADSPIRGPADLVGKRVGVRAYSQTTGLWLRGILQSSHGVAPDSLRWTTFEDAHVAECRDPPWATRAPKGQEMQAMLEAGDLDAAIFGNDAPKTTALRPVFPDAAAAGLDFLRCYGFVPVNHLLVVQRQYAEPALLAEFLRMLEASDALAPSGLAKGRVALMPAIAIAAHFAVQQGLINRAPDAVAIWDGLPSGIG